MDFEFHMQSVLELYIQWGGQFYPRLSFYEVLKWFSTNQKGLYATIHWTATLQDISQMLSFVWATLAFGNEPRQMLKSNERFGRYFSCHLWGEYVMLFEPLYRVGSRWRIGFDDADWWSWRAGWYSIGDENHQIQPTAYCNPTERTNHYVPWGWQLQCLPNVLFSKFDAALKCHEIYKMCVIWRNEKFTHSFGNEVLRKNILWMLTV
jgi:hypothetical protein